MSIARKPRRHQPLATVDGLAAVRSLAERLGAAEDLRDIADVVSSGARGLLDASALVLALADADGTLHPLVSNGTGPASPDVAAGPWRAALEGRQPVFWPSGDRPGNDDAAGDGSPTEESWAILPLVGRGEGLGVLALGWREPRSFPETDATLLGLVAHQCAAAIDRVRELQSERAIADLLAEGTRLMVSALDPDEIVWRLVRLAVPQLAPWCAVYAADGDQLVRVALEVDGSPSLVHRARDHATLPIGADLPLAEAYRSGEVRTVARVGREAVEPVYAELTDDLLGAARGYFAALIVPVKAAGRVLGVMSLVSDAWGGAPSPRLIQTAEGLAGRAGVALSVAGRYQQEHETAAVLTQALLPTEAAPLPGFEIASRYLPAEGSVAGDWFDVVRVAQDRYLVGVGDAAGHGIRAASLMAELRNAARGLAVAGHSPAEILRRLGWLVSETDPNGFATALYALAAPHEEVLTWASAGHTPPVFFDGAGASLLPTAGAAPIGSVGGAEPVDRQVRLVAGAGLVLFTDGVIEHRDGDLGKQLELLLEVVSSSRREPAEALADRIVGNLCGDHQDDCCVLVIRRAR